MNMKPRNLRLLSVLTLLLFCGLGAGVRLHAASPPEAAVAMVVAVRGDVQAVDARGVARQLELKAALFLGETIRTGKRGKVQFCFTDNTQVSLGRETEMKITEYAYDEAGKTGKLKTHVSQGVFRVMGGAVAKVAPENFKTVTPTATIGIRGSMYLGNLLERVLTVILLGGEGVTIENAAGFVEILQEAFASVVNSEDDPPGEPEEFDAEAIKALLEEFLDPTLGGEGAGGDDVDGPSNVDPDDSDPGNTPPPDADDRTAVEILREILFGDQADDSGDDVDDADTGQDQGNVDQQPVSYDMTGKYLAAATPAEAVRSREIERWLGDIAAVSTDGDIVGDVTALDMVDRNTEPNFAFRFMTTPVHESGAYTYWPVTKTGQTHPRTIDGVTFAVPYSYMYDNLGEFAVFWADAAPMPADAMSVVTRNLFAHEFSELGYLGIESAPPTGESILFYEGQGLTVFNGGLDARQQTTEAQVNLHNGRIIGVSAAPAAGETDLADLYFFGALEGGDATRGVEDINFLGRMDAHVLNGMSTHAQFYGHAQQGFGITGLGATRDLVDFDFRTAEGDWDHASGLFKVGAMNAQTGERDLLGLAVGLSEDVSGPGWGSNPLLMTDLPNEEDHPFELTLDRDGGVVSGVLEVEDVRALMPWFRDYGDLTFIDTVVGDPMDLDESAYIDDAIFLARLSGEEDAVWVGGYRMTPSGPIEEDASFLTSQLLANLGWDRLGNDGAADDIPIWATFGGWEVAYEDPTGEYGLHSVHAPAAMWWAADTANYVGPEDLLLRQPELLSRYEGGARAVHIYDSEFGLVYAPLAGIARFNVDFGTGEVCGAFDFDADGGLRLGAAGWLTENGIEGEIRWVAMQAPESRDTVSYRPENSALRGMFFDDPAVAGLAFDRLLGTFAAEWFCEEDYRTCGIYDRLIGGWASDLEESATQMIGSYLGAQLESGRPAYYGDEVVMEGTARATSFGGYLFGQACLYDDWRGPMSTAVVPFGFPTAVPDPNATYEPRDLEDPAAWQQGTRQVSLPDGSLATIDYSFTHDYGPAEFGIFMSSVEAPGYETFYHVDELGYVGVPAPQPARQAASGLRQYSGPLLLAADLDGETMSDQGWGKTVVNFDNGRILGIGDALIGSGPWAERRELPEDLPAGRPLVYFGSMDGNEIAQLTVLGSGRLYDLFGFEAEEAGYNATDSIAISGTGGGLFFGSQWQALGFDVGMGSVDVLWTDEREYGGADWIATSGQLATAAEVESSGIGERALAGLAVGISTDLSDPVYGDTRILMTQSVADFQVGLDRDAGAVDGHLTVQDVRGLDPAAEVLEPDALTTVGQLVLGDTAADSAYVNDDLFAAILAGGEDAVYVEENDFRDEAGPLAEVGNYLVSKDLAYLGWAGAAEVPMPEWMTWGAFELAYEDPSEPDRVYHLKQPLSLWVAADQENFVSLLNRQWEDTKLYSGAARAVLALPESQGFDPLIVDRNESGAAPQVPLAGLSRFDIDYDLGVFTGFFEFDVDAGIDYAGPLRLSAAGKLTEEGLAGRIVSIETWNAEAEEPMVEIPSSSAVAGAFFDDPDDGEVGLDRLLGTFAAEWWADFLDYENRYMEDNARIVGGFAVEAPKAPDMVGYYLSSFVRPYWWYREGEALERNGEDEQIWAGTTAAASIDGLVVGGAHALNQDPELELPMPKGVPFAFETAPMDAMATYVPPTDIWEQEENEDGAWQYIERVLELPDGLVGSVDEAGYTYDHGPAEFAMFFSYGTADSSDYGYRNEYMVTELGFAGVPADAARRAAPAGVVRYEGVASRAGGGGEMDWPFGSLGVGETGVNFANARVVGYTEMFPPYYYRDDTAGDLSLRQPFSEMGSGRTFYFGTVDGNGIADVRAFGSDTLAGLLGMPPWGWFYRDDPRLQVTLDGAGWGMFYGSQWQALGVVIDEDGMAYVADPYYSEYREEVPVSAWGGVAGQLAHGEAEAAPTGTGYLLGLATGLSRDAWEPGSGDGRLLMTKAPGDLFLTLDRDGGTVGGLVRLDDVRGLDPGAEGDLPEDVMTVEQLTVGGTPENSAYVTDSLFAALIAGDGEDVSVGLDDRVATGPLAEHGNYLVSGGLALLGWDGEDVEPMPAWATWGGLELNYLNPDEEDLLHSLHAPMSVWLAADANTYIGDLTAASRDSVTGVYEGAARAVVAAYEGMYRIEELYPYYIAYAGSARFDVDFGRGSFAGHLRLDPVGDERLEQLYAVASGLLTEAGIAGRILSLSPDGGEPLVPWTSALRGAFFEDPDVGLLEPERLLGTFAAQFGAYREFGLLNLVGGFATEDAGEPAMSGYYGAATFDEYLFRDGGMEVWSGRTSADSYDGVVAGTAHALNQDGGARDYPFGMFTEVMDPTAPYVARDITGEGAWDEGLRVVEFPDLALEYVPYRYTYDQGPAEFVLYTADTELYRYEAFIEFIDLGFAGVPALAADKPTGLGLYRAPAFRGTFAEVLRESVVDGVLVDSQTVVNYDNNRFMGWIVNPEKDDEPLRPDPMPGMDAMLYYGDIAADGSMENVRFTGVAGLADFSEMICDVLGADTPLELAGTGEGLFYGSQWQALGFSGTGTADAIVDGSRVLDWNVVSGQLLQDTGAAPPPGTETWYGFAAGVSEQVDPQFSGRLIFMNQDGDDFTLTLDRDNGRVTGTLSVGEALAEDATVRELDGVAVGADGKSAYVSDQAFVAELQGDDAVKVGAAVSDLHENGNVMVTAPPEAQASEWTTWGYWAAASDDPNRSAARQLHAATWVAGNRTPEAVVQALRSTNFIGSYTGGARCTEIVENSALTEHIGTSAFAVNFGIQQVKGGFDFSGTGGPTMTASGNFVNSNTGFVGSITAVSGDAPAASTFSGGFFGRTNHPSVGDVPGAVAGGFSARMPGVNPTKYTGTFDADFRGEAVPE